MSQSQSFRFQVGYLAHCITEMGSCPTDSLSKTLHHDGLAFSVLSSDHTDQNCLPCVMVGVRSVHLLQWCCRSDAAPLRYEAWKDIIGATVTLGEIEVVLGNLLVLTTVLTSFASSCTWTFPLATWSRLLRAPNTVMPSVTKASSRKYPFCAPEPSLL